MEKRRQQRIAKSLLAQVEKGGDKFFAYVQDVAKSGLGMTCNRLMEPKDLILVFLNAPRRPNMTLDGMLVWRRELPRISKSKYQYGVFVSEPPEEYENFIEAELQRVYDRRENPRFQDVLEVKNEDVIDLLDAATVDISAGGLYIRTHKPLEIGVQFEMMLSGKSLTEPVFCLGEVVASFETDPDDLEHRYGAGIRIVSYGKGHKDRFVDYIKGLEELYRFHWPPELDTSKLGDQ
jgi:PilZ domain